MAGLAGKMSEVKIARSERKHVSNAETHRIARKGFYKGVRQESRAVARAIVLGNLDAADETQ